MADDHLAAIRECLEKATPGPWEFELNGQDRFFLGEGSYKQVASVYLGRIVATYRAGTNTLPDEHEANAEPN